MAAGETASVPVEPWSAEVPRLYRGTLRSAGETVELAIGFRRVEIRDGVFTVNGRAVTFRGVNRHEHHPDTGRTLDRDTMIQDIVMMKRANVDAVRTSHYPPHPEFLRLCDEYGLWVRAWSAISRRTASSTRAGRATRRRIRVARRAAGSHAAHRRARQEPPERRHLVDGERELDRRRVR